MIKLIKHAFHNEDETREQIANFFKQNPFFSMGEKVREFETLFAEKQKRKYAVMVNSGRSANLLLIQALLNTGQLKQGDSVGFSALTWSTNVMPLIQLGLKPVPIDCEVDTMNISPAILAKELDSLDALFLTNVLGFSDDISRIQEMCAEADVLFIEDNCESLGSQVDGKLLGNFGEAATFSFFIGHHLSTIEGGMVVTDDEELFNNLLIARSHGWSRNITESKKHELQEAYDVDDFYAKYTFYDLGFNVRPMELNGFIGATQMPFWDEIVSKRFETFKYLHKGIESNESIENIRFEHMDIASVFAIPIIAKDTESYEKLRERFEGAGIEIRPIIAGDITHQPFYKKYVADERPSPNAGRIHAHGFYFGNNQHLSSDEIETLHQLITQA